MLSIVAKTWYFRGPKWGPKKGQKGSLLGTSFWTPILTYPYKHTTLQCIFTYIRMNMGSKKGQKRVKKGSFFRPFLVLASFGRTDTFWVILVNSQIFVHVSGVFAQMHFFGFSGFFHIFFFFSRGSNHFSHFWQVRVFTDSYLSNT